MRSPEESGFGIFGVFGLPHAKSKTLEGIFLLQGKEFLSAGIALSDGFNFEVSKIRDIYSTLRPINIRDTTLGMGWIQFGKYTEEADPSVIQPFILQVRGVEFSLAVMDDGLTREDLGAMLTDSTKGETRLTPQAVYRFTQRIPDTSFVLCSRRTMFCYAGKKDLSQFFLSGPIDDKMQFAGGWVMSSDKHVCQCLMPTPARDPEKNPKGLPYYKFERIWPGKLAIASREGACIVSGFNNLTISEVSQKSLQPENV